MTREEAIKYAEEKLSKGLYRLDLGYLNRGLYQIVAKEVDFMRVAISALREQESLEKKTSDSKTSDKKTSDWISVEEAMPDQFVSVLGYMTDAGEFPPVRECYLVGGAFFFPGLVDVHPVSHWMPMPKKEDT